MILEIIDKSAPNSGGLDGAVIEHWLVLEDKVTIYCQDKMVKSCVNLRRAAVEKLHAYLTDWLSQWEPNNG